VFSLQQLVRKQGWFIDNASFANVVNMAEAGLHFLLRSRSVSAWPLALKIDITPLCNLHCISCIHAHPHENSALRSQRFRREQRMSVDQFATIIDQVKGKTSAVSLYYYGDPYCHPDVDEMCGIARRAGMNVHASTNFSFRFTDERIEAIAGSGLTHLAVCVDGIRQETYSKTRVGGRVDLVLANLKRLCEVKHRKSLKTPEIEVQYLLYQHNLGEMAQARAAFLDMGVDRITTFWGALHNCTDVNPGNYRILGPRHRSLAPRCVWPFFFMVVKYNGDVVPCCEYRVGTQYVEGGDARVMGNVFESSVRGVWNGKRYRDARTLACHPNRVNTDPDLLENFCYGCAAHFYDDKRDLVKMGRDYSYEDLYRLEDGQPVPTYRARGCEQGEVSHH